MKCLNNILIDGNEFEIHYTPFKDNTFEIMLQSVLDSRITLWPSSLCVTNENNVHSMVEEDYAQKKEPSYDEFSDK